MVVPKPNNKFRCCIDFRHLNAVTPFEVTPSHTLSEALMLLSNAKIFSTIDLKNGYLHVPLSERSKPFTVFTTMFGRFQFRKMFFGLVNAPSTFQRYMFHIFQRLIGKYVVVYFDDIVIFVMTMMSILRICKKSLVFYLKIV